MIVYQVNIPRTVQMFLVYIAQLVFIKKYLDNHFAKCAPKDSIKKHRNIQSVVLNASVVRIVHCRQLLGAVFVLLVLHKVVQVRVNASYVPKVVSLMQVQVNVQHVDIFLM